MTGEKGANIRWTVWIRGGDTTDLDEQMTLLNTAANVYWFDGGVVIQTRPTGFGDYYDERVVPWSQVIDYRKERLDVTA